MKFKPVIFAILLAFCALKYSNVVASPKSKGEWTVEDSAFPSTSSLLLDFSKKFNNILEKCNEVGSSLKFCTDARTELLPMLNTLLKTIESKQDPIQSILGHGRNCLIRNRKFPEYFYAAGDWLTQFSNDKRLALTWLPGWFDDECYWDLERVETDAEPQYRIKSTKFGEYLYGARNNWHEDLPARRYVFTWRKHANRCEEQCFWDLKMIKTDESKTYFVLQNVESREYLYAIDDLTYETNSRYVFTKKYDSLKEIMDHLDAQWIIECK